MKMKHNLNLFLVMILLVSSLEWRSFASIPDQQTRIDFATIQPVMSARHELITADLFTKYFPTNLSPTSDPIALTTQIQTILQKRITDEFFATDFFKKSPVGQAQASVQNATNQGLVLSSSGPTSSAPQGITHRLKFDLKAFDRIAVVGYSGYFNSQVSYMMNTNNVKWDISKPLSRSTTLSYTNTMSISDPSNPTHNVSVVYSF